ncbi:hypothetical protein BS049_RS22850 [Vibrio parahaemolyticus]|nr:hypothetical protein [Vibrio parahaemolyticus]
MLTIIFAKTKISDVNEFLDNSLLHAIKSFGQINNDTVFAVLAYSKDLPELIADAVDVAELIKIHPIFRSNPDTISLVKNNDIRIRRQQLKRIRKKQTKAYLTPENWTRFIKYKHIRAAYFQSIPTH